MPHGCEKVDQSVCDSLQTFPTEFPVFLREHLDGLYRCDVYFFCRTMADVSRPTSQLIVRCLYL